MLCRLRQMDQELLLYHLKMEFGKVPMFHLKLAIRRRVSSFGSLSLCG